MPESRKVVYVYDIRQNELNEANVKLVRVNYPKQQVKILKLRSKIFFSISCLWQYFSQFINRK